MTRKIAILAATAGAAALAGCVPPAPQPTPAPSPAPAPAPRPSPATSTAPKPAYQSWMDAPQTAGDWTYRPAASGGAAQFGDSQGRASFVLRCDRAGRVVELARIGNAASAGQMRVLTEATERTVSASPANNGQAAVVARLGAQDSLLDAMAFSKGRFAIAVSGLDTLYLPAWPEVTRVIEDCR